MPKGVILTHGAMVSDVSAIHKHNVSCNCEGIVWCIYACVHTHKHVHCSEIIVNCIIIIFVIS